MALLIGLLLPALGSARRAARATVCLSNVRQIELGHTLYINANREYFVDAALPHGGTTSLDVVKRAWPVTLAEFVGGGLALRSPADRSPYWPKSQGGSWDGPGLTELLAALERGESPSVSNLARWTSYGLNNWLARSKSPGFDPGEPFDRLAAIPRPDATVHFLMMTQGLERAGFARSDHVHVEGWSDAGDENAPRVASDEVDLAAHGGKPKSGSGLASYSFLDGHAQTLPFDGVYRSYEKNKLHPLKGM